MQKSKNFTSLKLIFNIDFLFTILILIVPFVSFPFILNSIKDGKEIYLVSITSLWLLYKSIICFRNKFIIITKFDIFLFLFLFYNFINFFFISYYNIGYSTLWLFTSYIILIYLFINAHKSVNTFFKQSLLLITVIAFVESFISLFQLIDIFKTNNIFFNVMGTYINPNFLGVHMGLGILSLIALYFWFLKKNKKTLILFILLMAPMLFILVYTKSRATWIALLISILVLLFSSERVIKRIKQIKKRFLYVFMSLILIASSIAGYFLYKMNKDSVDGRGLILKLTYSKILEKPISGHGLFNFPGIYNQHKSDYFLSGDRSWEEIKVANYVSTAFNDYIHLIFELGLLGFIILFFVFYYLLKDIKLNNITRLTASILIFTIILAFFTSVIYNPTIMIIVAWSFATILHSKSKKKSLLEIKNTLIIKVLYLIFIFLSIQGILVFTKKTISLSKYKDSIIKLEKSHKDINGLQLFNNCKSVIENSHIEFRIGNELFWEGRKRSGLYMMNNAVKKSNVGGMNYVLSMVYEREKDNNKAEFFLKRAIGIEPFKFKPKIDLMDFYGRIGEFEKQKVIANEVVNFPVKISSKLVDEYKEKAKGVLNSINGNY